MRTRRTLIMASGATVLLLVALAALSEVQATPPSGGSQLDPTARAAAAWLAMAGTSIPPVQDPSITQSQVTGFVGEEECIFCHPDQGDSYELTKHGRNLDQRAPAGTNGCESCHGPGQAHADADGDMALIKRFPTMTATEVSDTCTTCHNRGEHAFWQGSQHDGRDLTCTTCHSVHAWESEKKQLTKPTQIELCG